MENLNTNTEIMSSKNYLYFIALLQTLYNRKNISDNRIFSRSNTSRGNINSSVRNQSTNNTTHNNMRRLRNLNSRSFPINFVLPNDSYNNKINNQINELEKKLDKFNETEIANNLLSLKEIIDSINEKVEKRLNLYAKEETPYKSPDLLDIITDNYVGVNITITLENSNTLVGQVLKCSGNVLRVKSNGTIYYINKDKILYFY